ncbi:MAG: paraquat-inducible protein A [Immundisolibacteraceae bacterium]|nr:paraquat-inducible protein A [Immundisolibacteraceae bacterium]
MSNGFNTASSRGLACCHLCLKLVRQDSHLCPRCGTAVHQRKANSLERTLALIVTASLLYIPANLLPIMITTSLGEVTESTIIGGVLLLVDMGSIAIALVIFFASVVIPLTKMAVIYYLCWSVKRGRLGTARQRTLLYRMVEFIGKWSMIDVFVVAILVALINWSGLLMVRPGPAALAFAGVVILSMIAAESFDPRLMWDLEPPAEQPNKKPVERPVVKFVVKPDVKPGQEFESE